MKPLKLIAIISVAILISLPSLAFAKGGKPPKDDPPVEPAVVYTVALTTGVFTFDAHEVTLNSRGYLKSFDTEPLVFERPEDLPEDLDEQEAWDAVIDNCAGPLLSNEDKVMLVNFDEWAVGRNGDDGNLWINFKNIRLPSGDFVPEKEIQIQLQLRDHPEITETFLPTDSKNPLTFELNWYVVWGKPLSGKGKKGWDTCYQTDLLPAVYFPDATLEIAYLGIEGEF
jgi:hypothetical protein